MVILEVSPVNHRRENSFLSFCTTELRNDIHRREADKMFLIWNVESGFRPPSGEPFDFASQNIQRGLSVPGGFNGRFKGTVSLINYYLTFNQMLQMYNLQVVTINFRVIIEAFLKRTKMSYYRYLRTDSII